MSEQEQVVETVQEVVETTEPIVEVESEQQEQPVDPTGFVDLSDFQVPQQQPVQQPEPEIDYATMIENIVAKAVAKANPQQANDDGDEIVDTLTRKDLEAIKNAATQEALQNFMNYQQSMQVIQQHVHESQQVEKTYGDRVKEALKTKMNVDLDADPVLRDVYNYSLHQMKMAEAQRLQRNQLVFTKQEMAQIVNNHWPVFSKNYLGYQRPTIAPGNSMSPAVNATVNQNNPAKQPDEYQQFLEKKGQRRETLSDAVNMLSLFAKK